MKKPKQHKTAAQLAKEAESKQAEKLRECLNGLHKVGKAVRFTFVCRIKKAIDCETAEAERHFEAAVSAGKVREAGRSILGDVIFFEAG